MRVCIVVLFLFLCGKEVEAQTAVYQPAEENLKNREWFRDVRFGMFIHWGIYSMLANGEWVLEQKGLKENEYQNLASGFYPSRFDADEWVRVAKEAGMKYICITSRHHDGFSMFDTKQSDYNIVKATPFKRDVIAELAEACRKAGLKLFFYYSHLDWHRTDYVPLGSTGRKTGREMTGKWEDYLAFMDAQLTELLTNYGPVGGIWFDG
ncbi:MAG: alpha-L-fucosidase, partial [Odoribacter sp.]|nr:alpha-L-fucosidase [Odoribacter sp.]